MDICHPDCNVDHRHLPKLCGCNLPNCHAVWHLSRYQMGVVTVTGKHRATPNRRMWWQLKESLRHYWFHWLQDVRVEWASLRADFRDWNNERKSDV